MQVFTNYRIVGLQKYKRMDGHMRRISTHLLEQWYINSYPHDVCIGYRIGSESMHFHSIDESCICVEYQCIDGTSNVYAMNVFSETLLCGTTVVIKVGKGYIYRYTC